MQGDGLFLQTHWQMHLVLPGLLWQSFGHPVPKSLGAKEQEAAATDSFCWNHTKPMVFRFHYQHYLETLGNADSESADCWASSLVLLSAVKPENLNLYQMPS